MLVVRGGSSNIVNALRGFTSGSEEFCALKRDELLTELKADRYLFAQGYLAGERISDQSSLQMAEAFLANTALTICDCDHILEFNKKARICVIGSESGYSWSYDSAYAASKAGIHKYVETKRLQYPGQQLVAVAPGIIEDAGMTHRRKDQDGLQERRLIHPKGRFLTCKEVANLIYFLLYQDQGFITNVVIRMTGGEHVR